MLKLNQIIILISDDLGMPENLRENLLKQNRGKKTSDWKIGMEAGNPALEHNGEIWVLLTTAPVLISYSLTFFSLAENPPSIHTLTKTPSTFKNGDFVTLHCQAGGDSPRSYQWFAVDLSGNNKDLSGSRFRHQSNTGQLVISNLQHSQDDGYYYCVAINPAGRVRSKGLAIRVSCELYDIKVLIGPNVVMVTVAIIWSSPSFVWVSSCKACLTLLLCSLKYRLGFSICVYFPSKTLCLSFPHWFT